MDITDIDLLEQTLKTIGMQPEKHYYRDTTSIALNEGKGYSGFSCVFSFNKDGKFEHHACWE